MLYLIDFAGAGTIYQIMVGHSGLVLARTPSEPVCQPGTIWTQIGPRRPQAHFVILLMRVGLVLLQPNATMPFNANKGARGCAGVPQDRCQDRCRLPVLVGEDPEG